MTTTPSVLHRTSASLALPAILSIALAAAGPSAAVRAESAVWDKEKLARAAIYYSDKNVPPPPARGTPAPADITEAAADLQEYLFKITGIKVPVEQRKSAAEIPGSAPAIVLGTLARELGAVPPVTEFAEDGYVLERKDDRLLIAGESDRGTAYGVSDFLARQGVRFYMPGPLGEDVPRRESLTIPDAVSETPDWEDRRLWLMGGAGNRFEDVAPEVPGWFRDWQRRNRVDTADRVATSHMWANVFKSAGITREEALEKHPDWFVTVNGARNPRHLNLLNDEVVDLFVNHLRKQLAGQPKDTRRVLSLSPDDQVIVNESIEAQKFLSRKDIIFTNLPDATDYLIQFNNRVVQRLNQEYPHVRLAFYIYSNYQNAPTDVALDKNLIPFIAPLNFSRYHALSDSSKSNRTLLASIVDRWHAHGAKLGWRDYAFLCPDAMMPFTRLHMTRKDIPWLHERGARYISTETVSNWPNLLPEYWLLAGLLWDVQLDQEAALAEFYDRFYGPAARSMRAYTDEITETYDSLPFSAGNKEFVESTFTPERLRSLREKIDAAKLAVAGDDIRLHRVKLVETALNQAARFLRLRAAINRFDYPEAAKIDREILQAWDDDIAFDGLTNTMFVKDRWHRRYFSDHITRINQWLEGAKVLHVFPDEWPAHFDLTQTGALEGLMRPESRAFERFSLKTYSRSLAEQGWEKFRGDIWYRNTFPKVEVPDGYELCVLFGGVDRFLKAWINGQEIGEGSGERAFNPVLLKAGTVRLGDTNTLTVRVSNTAPTELGVGGLLRPVALIATPKAE